MSSADITMTNNYWNMLRNLNDEVKLRLASMLTASVVEHKNKSVSEKVSITEAMVKKYAGAWEDDRTSDEIISDVYASRSSKPVIDFSL
jgi:hypothetical protein